MERVLLTGVGDKYDVVAPIYVKVAASNGCDGCLYWLSIENLQNELIFGVGRTKASALEMLTELLTDYYESLMSSDLDRHYIDENFIADKIKLSRSIKCKHN